jgi:competence protein ComEA
VSADGGAAGSPGVLPDGRVVLNAANEDALRTLSGIGPKRAQAILALRQRLVRFRAVEDLLRVKGIGRKTLSKIKPKIVLNWPS